MSDLTFLRNKHGRMGWNKLMMMMMMITLWENIAIITIYKFVTRYLFRQQQGVKTMNW